MKLFRKLSVLALAVLLVCALSAAAVAGSWDSKYQYYDTGYIVATARIHQWQLFGEIRSELEITEYVSGQITYGAKRLYHAGYTDSVIDFVEVYDTLATGEEYTVAIDGNTSVYYVTEATCRFQLTVTAYGGYYGFDQTTAELCP